MVIKMIADLTLTWNSKEQVNNPYRQPMVTHHWPSVDYRGPPVGASLYNQSLVPPVVTVPNRWSPVEFFFEKMNFELWKIIENYYFNTESEGYLFFQKFISALKQI